MRVWFTSDPHWGHEFVAKDRGFASAAEHDEWLDDVYRTHFADTDTVWWLGDLTIRLPVKEAVARCTDTQPLAKHHLVFGNHDKGHPMHRHAYRSYDDYADFDSVQPFARRRGHNRVDILMSHFPYNAPGGDHTEINRYPQWRLPDLGSPLIHGHTHSDERVSFTENGTVQVHVGIDAWKRPVSLDEVLDLIRESRLP